MDKFFSIQNLPNWLVLAGLIVYLIVEVRKNKIDMDKIIDVTVENIKEICEKCIIKNDNIELKNVFIVIFISKFKLELYVKIIHYLNTIDYEYDISIEELLKTTLLSHINSVVYESKEFLNNQKININCINNFDGKELVVKIIDILKMNGKANITLKKSYLKDIILTFC